MRNLRVYLLGKRQFILNGKNISAEMTTKGEALLAYLLMNRTTTHHRDKLAELLWSESSKETSRYNLRYTLWTLRKCLNAGDNTEDYFISPEKDACQFKKVGKFWLDVEEFEAGAGIGLNPKTPVIKAIEVLEQTISFYQGDFLADFYVKASSAFDDWVFFERERLQGIYFRALSTLAKLYTEDQKIDKGIACLNKLLAVNPLQEDVHRELIRLYYLSGNRSRAIQQYQTCCRILRQELNVSPMQETKRLYQQIIGEDQEQLAVETTTINTGPKEGKEGVDCLNPKILTDYVRNQDKRVLFLAEVKSGERLEEILRILKEGEEDSYLLLRGLGYPAGNAPFEGLRRVLQGLLGELSENERAWRNDLSLLFPELLSPEEGICALRFTCSSLGIARLLHAVHQILQGIVQRKKVAVIFENLQWMDEQSLQAFYYLSHQEIARNFLLGGTYFGNGSPYFQQVLCALQNDPDCLWITGESRKAQDEKTRLLSVLS